MKKFFALFLVLCFVCVTFKCIAGEAYQHEIKNVTLADSSTWYKVDCADSTTGKNILKVINVKCRQSAEIKFSFQSNGATYFSIPAGYTYYEQEIDIPLVFYLQGSNDNDVAEVIIYR